MCKNKFNSVTKKKVTRMDVSDYYLDIAQIKTKTESIILRFYASTLHFYYARALSNIWVKRFDVLGAGIQSMANYMRVLLR